MKRIGSVRSVFWRAAVPVTVVLTIGGAFQAATQSTPAAAQAAPPTTENPLQQLLEGLLGGPPTTVAPAPASTTPAPAEPLASPAAPAAPQGDGTDPVQPQGVPPDAQAQIDAIQRTGGRSTTQLMSLLRQLEQVGYTEAEAAAMGMGHFPVAGDAAWSDDFLFPRFTPTFHMHQGNDIFAARGTPVRAPDDGTVRFGEEPVGGKAAYVTRVDGTYYFMCHLDDYADIPSGSHVTQGQIVGYTGDTGDATGGATHVHFEIHPGGGPAVNPKPILDRWVDEAMAAAPALLATFKINLPHALISTGQLRRFDLFESNGPGAEAGTLQASSVAPVGGLVQQATPEDWQQAQDVSRALLTPLTPRALEKALTGGAS